MLPRFREVLMWLRSGATGTQRTLRRKGRENPNSNTTQSVRHQFSVKKMLWTRHKVLIRAMFLTRIADLWNDFYCEKYRIEQALVVN